MIRKREKIQQETASEEAIESKQDKLIDQASNHLDRERKKFEELKRSEEAESKHLLEAMVNLAKGEKSDVDTRKETKNIDAAQVENEADGNYLHHLLEFLEANGAGETNAKGGTTEKAEEDNKSDIRQVFGILRNLQSKNGELKRFLEPLEKKKIAFLARDLSAGIDLNELSGIISDKAQTLETEIEFMEAKLAMSDAEKENEQESAAMEEVPKEGNQEEQKKEAKAARQETVVDESPKDCGQEDQEEHALITDLEEIPDAVEKDNNQEEQVHQSKNSDHETIIEEAPKDENQEEQKEQDQQAAIALLAMVQEEESKDANENGENGAIEKEMQIE